MNEWLPLATFFVLTMAMVSGASWRLSLAMDKLGETLRSDFNHQIELANSGRQREMEQFRQALRDQDNKVETFRREMMVAQRDMVTKDDLRQLITKIDQLSTTISQISSDLAAVRGRELRRAEDQR